LELHVAECQQEWWVWIIWWINKFCSLSLSLLFFFFHIFDLHWSSNAIAGTWTLIIPCRKTRPDIILVSTHFIKNLLQGSSPLLPATKGIRYQHVHIQKSGSPTLNRLFSHIAKKKSFSSEDIFECLCGLKLIMRVGVKQDPSLKNSFLQQQSLKNMHCTYCMENTAHKRCWK